MWGFSLAGIGLALLIAAGVVVFLLLFVLEIGMGVATDALWERMKRRRKPGPRFPWSDRTGT